MAGGSSSTAVWDNTVDFHLNQHTRQSYRLAVIFRRKYQGNTIRDMFKKAHRKEITIFIGSENVLNELVNRSVNGHNQICLFTKLQQSLFPTPYSYNCWLMSAFVVPFLACLLRTKFMDTTVNIYVKHENNSTLHDLLNWNWLENKETLLGELQLLIANPDKWFCFRCTPDCQFAKYAWHWNLEQFLPKEYKPMPATLKTDSVDVLGGTASSLSKIMGHLKRLWEVGETSVNVFDHVITNNAIECETDFWFTYLLLYVDGKNMDKYRNEDVTSLISKPDVEVALYAGMTKNKELRLDHFKSTTYKSSVAGVLTKTSRIFVLRSRKFPTIELAKADEAKLILMSILRNRQDISDNKKPFGVLNNQSESTSLRFLSQDEQNDVKRFVASCTPIVKPSGMEVPYHLSDFFAGNAVPISIEEYTQIAPRESTYKTTIPLLRQHKYKLLS